MRDAIVDNGSIRASVFGEYAVSIARDSATSGASLGRKSNAQKERTCGKCY